MKYIQNIIIILLFIFGLFLINNKYSSRKSNIKSFAHYKQTNIIPVDNIVMDLGKILIPSHNIEEIISINTKDNIMLSMSSDSLSSDAGNIILKSLLSLKELSLNEHIIVDTNNICYVFIVEEIGSLIEYNKSINISGDKHLYLLNESENMFIKAKEFYKNNTNDLT